MKAKRTNLRRLFFAAIILFGAKPSPVAFAIGCVTALIGIAIHFWASGYLVKRDQLAASGPYGIVRNPLYVGSLLTDIGLGVMAGAYAILILYVLLASALVLARVRKEELFLGQKFGAEYESYGKHVPRFLPRFQVRIKPGLRFRMAQVRTNRAISRAARHVLLILIIAALHFVPEARTNIGTPYKVLIFCAYACGILLWSVLPPGRSRYLVSGRKTEQVSPDT